MAAKKKTTKKADPQFGPAAPPPADASPQLVRKYSFNILDEKNEDFLASTRDSLFGVQSRRKNHPTGFRSMAEIQAGMIPYRHFYLQWALGNYGMPEGCVLEVIGAKHLGKSTFLYWLLGGAMLHGCPCCVQESEGKPLTLEWAGRALSPDRQTARVMLSRLGVYAKTFALAQMDQQMIDWYDVARGRRIGQHKTVPLETPMVMGIDTFSKMMSPAEAAGFHDYGDNLSPDKKKKAKATGEASNLGHSKWSQAWGRRLPDFMSSRNGVVIVISHQNDKVDMSGGGASYMSADASALYNTTAIGGRALGQNAAVQLVVARKALVKNSQNDKIGVTVKMRVEKNSYGPTERVIEYDLINDQHDDTETTLAPSLDFDRGMCDWMATHGYIETTVSKKRFSSPVLGLTNVKAREFSEAFHAEENRHIREGLGRQLKIRGYEDCVDRIKEGVDATEASNS